MSAPSAAIETPSGKGARDENFPVGSFLLPKRLRPHVAVYYAFARAIDDIADNPALAPQDKLARLDAMDRAVAGEVPDGDPALAKAYRLRDSLAETGVDPAHARDLISAFRQDAVKSRYADWAELMDYCDRSAAPVGRFLLELHGEARSGFAQSDALCNALQVLNHLQDCGDDYRQMDRVYLPQDWLREEGERVEALSGSRSTPALRRVQMRCLAATRTLLREAERLPGVLRQRSLAMESAVIVAMAWSLLGKLERMDPLERRVVLSKPHFAWCATRGVASVLLGGRVTKGER